MLLLIVDRGSASSHWYQSVETKNNLCADQPNGTIFPVHDSYRLYIVCNNGVEIIQSCPPNVEFDPITGFCDVDDGPITTLAADTTNPETTTEKPKKTCQNSPDHTTLPHPKCTMFYYCFDGRAHEDKCSFGMHWSATAGKCDSIEMARCIDGEAPEQWDAVPQPTFPTEIPPSGYE